MKVSNLLKAATVIFCVMFMQSVLAQVDNGWTWSTRAQGSFSSFDLTEIQDSHNEYVIFVDGSHLNRRGFGAGYIRQDQGLNNRDDIVNDILFLNGWYRWFPQWLPGRLDLAVSYYDGSESTTSTSGGGPGNPNPGNPNPGNTDPGNTEPGNPALRASKPGPVTVTSFEDSLSIISPVIAYMNYAKTLYIDLSYAHSEYDTSNTTAGNLTVDQLSPAIGWGLNNQYDWLQIRLYYVDLSNDNRTPGTSSTLAANLSWTHWFKAPGLLAADRMFVGLLLGERLYAVDSDTRKIYNLTDLQRGSLSFGMHWKNSSNLDLYAYTGYEQYRDIANNDDYSSLYLLFGIFKQW